MSVTAVQPPNALTPIQVTLAGTVIVLSEEQPLNARCPIVSTPSGSAAVSRAVQPSKVLPLMVFIELPPKVTLVRAAQFMNALAPIEVTLAGMPTTPTLLEVNAFSSIIASVLLFVNCRFEIEEFANALFLIVFTSSGIAISPIAV